MGTGSIAIAEPLQYKPEQAFSYNTAKENQFEIDPPGGFFMRFRHGPNSTAAIFQTEAGKGRDIAIRINRHNEEAGIVIKGSVLFKAGYNGEFTRVLRAGDVLVVPKCVPHGGIFGWDNDEETILFTTFVGEYVEYGPDNLDHPPQAMAEKIHYDKASGVAATQECAEMVGAPPLTWSIDDIKAP
jgi:quercetin dioxygenase-like cupin family protein